MWISKQLNLQHLPYSPNPQPQPSHENPTSEALAASPPVRVGCVAHSPPDRRFFLQIMEFSPQFVQGIKKLGLEKKHWEKNAKNDGKKTLYWSSIWMYIKTGTKTIKTQQTHDCL